MARWFQLPGFASLKVTAGRWPSLCSACYIRFHPSPPKVTQKQPPLTNLIFFMTESGLNAHLHEHAHETRVAPVTHHPNQQNQSCAVIAWTHLQCAQALRLSGRGFGPSCGLGHSPWLLLKERPHHSPTTVGSQRGRSLERRYSQGQRSFFKEASLY